MRVRKAFTLTLAALAVAAGCSAASSGPGGSGGAGGGGAVLGAGGGSGTVGTGGSGALPPLPEGCAGPRCSNDLHSLIDCDGRVIMTCPGDQGCLGDRCVGACQSAAENKSSVGCEYFITVPDVAAGANGACFAAYVVNTWSEPVGLSVSYGGQTLDPRTFSYIPSGTGAQVTYAPLPNGQIPPGQVAILFLNRFGGSLPGLNFSCPPNVGKAIANRDAALHGTGIGNAFHVTTTAPVAAYDIYPYGGGQSAVTSATLLLPTSSWGDNYVAIDAYGGTGIAVPGLGSWIQIVSQRDGTRVTINPRVRILQGPGVPAAPPGQPVTYTLDRGKVLQITQGMSLNGSVIQADHPVGFWGGKTSIGIAACCEDSAHQQIPPVRAWGREYVGVRYRNRFDHIEESPPWRIVAAVNGTQLTWEPAPPPGAPTVMNLGDVVEFNASGPFVVRSQDEVHPIYLSAHMTGASLLDPSEQDGRGDAEFVNVIPPGNWLDRYVFFADPTYPETNLVVIRQRGPDGFAPVFLDCRGELDGWRPVGSSGVYEYTYVDLMRGRFEPQGGCSNGRREMRSDRRFGLTVWGWGSAATGNVGAGFYTQYVSYAYPGGAGVEPINTVVVPPVPE